MTMLARLRIDWSGSALVGPGLTTLYFDSSKSGFSAAVVTFMNAIKAQHPAGVSWTVPGFGDLIDSETGDLTGAWSETGGNTVIAASAGGVYSLGVGYATRWDTGSIVRGSRVRGRSYWAPALGSVFGSNGLMTTAANNSVAVAANALVSAVPGALMIWTRPNGTDGGHASAVISATVPNTPTWLRSRRV